MIAKDRIALQQQIYNFLRTVTIKYDPIAQYLNNSVIAKGYAVNDSDPASWKYYLNIQGKYHPSDTLMYVTSLDDQQVILFSADVLVFHPRTRSVYIPGGLYYTRLCDTYPEQVDLIKSILFPVADVDKAISCDNLTLLAYGPGYLEDYEEKMIIMEIENFLDILVERWYFDFLDDEPYFYLTFWGSLWTYLAMLIMSARESYIRTPYVHSWHLWNYLKDQGLDDYSDVLDRKKSMMLYQNIGYLKDNAGKQSNLVLLADRLLSDFGVSIYGRKVVEEAETNAVQYQLVPQLQAVRVPTDTSTINAEISSETVATIQAKVFSKALTPENTAEAAEVIARRLGDTTINDFMTKFLEIRPITKNKIYSDTLNMFLLETLTTSIIKDYYNQPVFAIDPATGASLFLYPRELLALYHYATCKSIGITPINIPNKFSMYKAFLTEIGTPTPTIKRGDETLYISSFVDPVAWLADLNYETVISEPQTFTDMITRLWLRYMAHQLEDQNTLIEKKSFILQYMASMCHTRRVEEVQLVAGHTVYSEWLGPEGIDIASSVVSQYDVLLDSETAWGNLADSIMSALVPINDTLSNFGNFVLSDLGYSRLRQLFVQMCSYRVVFLDSSRSLPEFAIGAKWSNQYGPDNTHTFADRVIIHEVQTQDTLRFTKDLILHRGFIQHRENKSVSSVNYTVTSVSETKSIATHQMHKQSKSITRMSGTNMAQGPLNLVHNGAIPTGIMDIDRSTNSQIIDDDGAVIIDDNGDILVDPNS